MADDFFPVIEAVVNACQSHQIPYALGGSMASSMLGRPRFTQDADITVEPFPGKETEFVACFGSEFFVNLDAVKKAIAQRSSFNILHPNSGFKVDVFVRKDRPFDQSFMSRRQTHQLPDHPDKSIVMVTPEDIVLLKLEWYRLGDEISDRQWSDVLGVLQVQAGRLDNAYLDHWAAELGVGDLLIRAREDSVV